MLVTGHPSPPRAIVAKRSSNERRARGRASLPPRRDAAMATSPASPGRHRSARRAEKMGDQSSGRRNEAVSPLNDWETIRESVAAARDRKADNADEAARIRDSRAAQRDREADVASLSQSRVTAHRQPHRRVGKRRPGRPPGRGRGTGPDPPRRPRHVGLAPPLARAPDRSSPKYERQGIWR
jgi:hypothetical protein